MRKSFIDSIGYKAVVFTAIVVGIIAIYAIDYVINFSDLTDESRTVLLEVQYENSPTERELLQFRVVNDSLAKKAVRLNDLILEAYIIEIALGDSIQMWPPENFQEWADKIDWPEEELKFPH